MKKNMTVISVLAMVVLAGICFEFRNPQSSQAQAQSSQAQVDVNDLSLWRANFGVANGQIVRVTVVNLATGRNDQPLTFQCLFFDRDGNRVFTSARTEVALTRFGLIDMAYGDFDMASELGTGRKQVQAEVVIEGLIDANSTVPVQLEIVNQVTGATEVHVPQLWILTKHFQD